MTRDRPAASSRPRASVSAYPMPCEATASRTRVSASASVVYVPIRLPLLISQISYTTVIFPCRGRPPLLLSQLRLALLDVAALRDGLEGRHRAIDRVGVHEVKR